MTDDLSWLLGQDMMTATYWMDTRNLQGEALAATPGSGVTAPRQMGTAATAAWQAFRQVVPWQVLPPATRASVPPGQLAYDFMQANPASLFYPSDSSEPVVHSSLRAAVRAASARTFKFAKTRTARGNALRGLLLEESAIARKSK